METEVVQLNADRVGGADVRDAAALIDSGGLVAFPTETVYGIACRVERESLARLDNIKGRTAEKHYTLHIGRSDTVDKYLPHVGLKARKLIGKAWPGPLTVVFELSDKHLDEQRERVAEEVFDSLYRNKSIGIRCPDNAIASALLQQTVRPVVAPSANLTGSPPAVDADQVLVNLAGKVEMVLDGGPCKYKESSTVVKIGKKGVKVLRHGVYSRDEVNELSQIRFLFVCTGNSCRSPMAEGIFRKYLAEKLRCDVDDLDDLGYKVCSAGISGSFGFPASPEAVRACAADGIDITAHRNQGLTRELVDVSDFIYAMEHVHMQRIIALNPEAANKCSLLAEPKGIPDPIGLPQEYYDGCAKTIAAAVRARIDELEI
ncbi:MAG: threonylcarbamoyl-AMP synthase [Phycisphaerales bacterium]|nr:MAG: threonylcarbamoyl-AMP synthase [Phycisphaerales bacterium]